MQRAVNAPITNVNDHGRAPASIGAGSVLLPGLLLLEDEELDDEPAEELEEELEDELEGLPALLICASNKPSL